MTTERDAGVPGVMKHLGQRDVESVNRADRRTGGLFEGRFRCAVIEADASLLACQRDIALNPVRAARVVAPGACLLTSSYDEQTDLKLVAERLEELKQSLLDLGIALAVQVNDRLHDREIRIDTGWVIKIGRGLDLFQRPESWHGVGAHDLTHRRCLETKVDIFRVAASSGGPTPPTPSRQ